MAALDWAGENGVRGRNQGSSQEEGEDGLEKHLAGREDNGVFFFLLFFEHSLYLVLIDDLNIPVQQYSGSTMRDNRISKSRLWVKGSRGRFKNTQKPDPVSTLEHGTLLSHGDGWLFSLDRTENCFVLI